MIEKPRMPKFECAAEEAEWWDGQREEIERCPMPLISA
jgi:hypothetical protein